MDLTSYYPASAPANGRELSRLLTAAVINQKFCKLLLTNPAIAMATGYNGEPFSLASEERDLILSIHAKSLPEFAMQLTLGQKMNINSPKHHEIQKRRSYRHQV
jgi:hypothetical protein